MNEKEEIEEIIESAKQLILDVQCEKMRLFLLEMKFYAEKGVVDDGFY